MFFIGVTNWVVWFFFLVQSVGARILRWATIIEMVTGYDILVHNANGSN